MPKSTLPVKARRLIDAVGTWAKTRTKRREKMPFFEALLRVQTATLEQCLPAVQLMQPAGHGEVSGYHNKA